MSFFVFCGHIAEGISILLIVLEILQQIHAILQGYKYADGYSNERNTFTIEQMQGARIVQLFQD